MADKHPTALAHRYVECIRTRDLAVIVSLFASDASCVMPDGSAFAGTDAVVRWFTKIFASQALTPQIVATVADDNAVAVEIENVLPDGTKRNTANFFHLDSAGLISQLRVYRRG